MVAALSFAFDLDLRSEMEALNYPVDDAAFTQLVVSASASLPLFCDGFESGDLAAW